MRLKVLSGAYAQIFEALVSWLAGKPVINDEKILDPGSNGTNMETLSPIDLPQMSVGAPLPRVYMDEHRLLIVYIGGNGGPDWKGTAISSVTEETEREVCVLLEADSYVICKFGLPNDEALSGHRLFKLGLSHYSSFEVLNSAWISELEQMNRVHPKHDARMYDSCRHFILTFHDSTLEFVADNYSVRVVRGSVQDVFLRALL